MSHSVVGVVDSSFTKTKSTRIGDKIINYISVEGVEISTGFKAAHSEGEMINIAVKYQFGEWQKIEGKTGDGLPKCDGLAPVKTTSFTPTGSRGVSRKFPIDPTDGQMSIIRQNSMNRAVEILENWMAAPTELFMPTTQDEYLKKLHEVALTITDFNSGGDIMKLIAADKMKEAING